MQSLPSMKTSYFEETRGKEISLDLVCSCEDRGIFIKMSSCDTLQKVKHDEGTDSDDEELDPESFAQQQSAAEATQGSETVSIETDVVTETMDEDDFLLELEAYNRRNNSRQRESIQQPIKVEQKPPPTIEDAEERAKAFQLARANKVLLPR